MPPYSSGNVRPNTPSSATLPITSSGMYSFLRCHSWACGINSIETEAAHQVLDLCVRLIEPGVAERHRARLRCDQLAEPRFDRLRSRLRRSDRQPILRNWRTSALRHTERLGTDDLDLAHRNATGNLSRVFCRRPRSEAVARIRRTGPRHGAGSPIRASDANLRQPSRATRARGLHAEHCRYRRLPES